VFGLLSQLEISVIGCPLKGTGLGDTVTCTAPVPPPGDGLGLGDGDGAGEPTGLLERDGEPSTVDGEVGSVEPQLTATNAAMSAMTARIQVRMFLRDTAGRRVARRRLRKTRTCVPQVSGIGYRASGGQVSGVRYQLSGVRYQVLGIRVRGRC